MRGERFHGYGGAIVPAPGVVSCSTGMRRFHVAAGSIASPDDPDLPAQGDLEQSIHALPPRIEVQPPGKPRFPCRLFELAAPQKSSTRGHIRKFSFVDALAGRPRLWPGLRPSSAHRRTTSMAAKTLRRGQGEAAASPGDATASGKAFMPPPNPALAAVDRRLACTPACAPR